MKTKNIYWIIGVAAVAGVGIIGYKKGWFGEKKSNAAGNCDIPVGSPPYSTNEFCTSWDWDKKKCIWVCKDSVKPSRRGGPLYK
jgi:hypothetical protein